MKVLKMKKDFEIHIKETKTQSSVIPVHWCVSEELLEEIKKEQEHGKKPFVLLVTIPEKAIHCYSSSNLERRKLVPLSDLMTYIDFKCAGENFIAGIIVWKGSDFVAKYRNGYETHVFGWDYDNLDKNEPVFRRRVVRASIKNATDIIKVHVPQEVFAPAPPKWEQHWVYLLSTNKSHDQCEFRKKRLFAYTFQLFLWLPVYTAIRLLVATIWFLFGFKIARVRAAFDVINTTFEEVFIENEYKLVDRWIVFPWIKSEWKHAANIFHPVFWIINIIISPSAGFSFLLIPSIVLGIMLFCLLCIYLSSSNIMQSYKNIVSSIFYKRSNKTNEKKLKEKAELLLCNGQQFYSSKSIPKKHRSYRLRFEEIKSKVCRPFSG